MKRFLLLLFLLPSLVFSQMGVKNDVALVPVQDSAANNTIADVIGNKTDTHNGTSIYSKLETLEDHIHKASNVYPTLTDGVDIVGGAAWTLGVFSEVVPASTITSDFDIHHINIEAISVNDSYELVLYACEADTEIGRVRFIKNAVQDGTYNVPFQSIIIDANCKIRAKVASASGSDTVTISIFYHLY